MPAAWLRIRTCELAPAADVRQGVFETVLIDAGRPRSWTAHRARLAASAAVLYGAPLPADLDGRVAESAAGRARARMRIDLRPAAGGAVTIEVRVGAAPAGAGEGLLLAPVRVAGGFGPHKLADRAWLEGIESASPAGARALLVTGEDRVLETTRANVFALAGGVLRTPPADGAILPGVTRRGLLEGARALGLEVREEPLTLAELHASDAILLTNALRGVELALERAAAGSVARALVAAGGRPL